MSNRYRLKSSIDASARTHGNDVRAVKIALNGLGHYSAPEWGSQNGRPNHFRPKILSRNTLMSASSYPSNLPVSCSNSGVVASLFTNNLCWISIIFAIRHTS